MNRLLGSLVVCWLAGVSGCLPWPVADKSDTPTAIGDDDDDDDDDTTNSGLVTEVFVQGPRAVMDVLFVIDNSCSMSNHQGALIDSAPTFLSFFLGSGIDFHLGVVSTDLSSATQNGRLQEAGGVRWIDNATSRPDVVFNQMARLGTAGSGTEEGLGAAYMAIEVEGDGYNAGFVRDNAAMHVIVLSNEDDQTQRTLITTDDFITWFSALRPDGARTFSSIVGGQGFDAGDTYVAVTQAVGGALHPIDDPRYDAILQDLAFDSGLVRIFCLSQAPDPSTVAVSITSTDGAITTFDVGVDVLLTDQDCVHFLLDVPEPGATVTVTYEPA